MTPDFKFPSLPVHVQLSLTKPRSDLSGEHGDGVFGWDHATSDESIHLHHTRSSQPGETQLKAAASPVARREIHMAVLVVVVVVLGVGGGRLA